ncbi:MAG: hypothetical protein IPJ81_11420 [Chitinophagaceae bacterium]|nr:hypothetical protein [Chitinophagaceae bacterium]
MKPFLLLLYYLLINLFFATAQMPDSVLIKDAQSIQDYYSIQATSTENNKFIDMGPPVSVSIIKHNYDSEKNTVFYILTGLVLLLGILKVLYYRYFQTLFRVFFNTSLRQSQLTDQLLIAKLQSLIFNIFL